MPRMLEAICTTAMLLSCTGSCAQGGVRLILWNYEPIYSTQGYGDVQHIGVGYDQDLNERLSFGVQGRTTFDGHSWVINYRSAYHMADNTSGSVYFGPTVGVRHLKD
ncbi:MAG TPA: hypothetical protein PLB89_01025 [Flavobacteriales bacterium]|nr:hypothetical protein [Flavobacteriales bacterium]